MDKLFRVRFQNAYMVECKLVKDHESVPYTRFHKYQDDKGDFIVYKHKKVRPDRWLIEW